MRRCWRAIRAYPKTTPTPDLIYDCYNEGEYRPFRRLTYIWLNRLRFTNSRRSGIYAMADSNTSRSTDAWANVTISLEAAGLYDHVHGDARAVLRRRKRAAISEFIFFLKCRVLACRANDHLLMRAFNARHERRAIAHACAETGLECRIYRTEADKY